MRRPSLVVLVLALAWWISPTAPVEPKGCLGGLLPNLQTVVPKHLQIQNEHQRELLRFTNGIANRGQGRLQLRPDPPPETATTVTNGPSRRPSA